MVTLVAHEWLAEVGGSENVFEQIRRTLPDHRAVCLWNEDPERFPGVEETWLTHTALRRHKVAAMPFMGSAWGRVGLDGVDRVVASSHAFCHHLATRAATVGIPAFAYVHSPARYVWAPDLDSRGRSAVGRIGRQPFRLWDRRHTTTEVRYATNSRFVADRIADAWGVSATVIYPPVNTDRAHDVGLGGRDAAAAATLPREFVLGASRLVPYKNLEAAISAGEIVGLPVVIAGAGPDEQRLRAAATRARVPVTFVGRVSDSLLTELYLRASLFVYMPIEDFGIMPVEAISCGTPVIVNEVGGAAESVRVTGGGVATGWRHHRFTDPAAVHLALGLDATPGKAAVSAFSIQAFRRNLRLWMQSPDRGTGT